MKTADKVKLAVRTESVYLVDRSPADCKFSHDRVAWHLEDGSTVLVAYKIYRAAKQFAADGLFSDAGRKDRVKDLADRVVAACLPG